MKSQLFITRTLFALVPVAVASGALGQVPNAINFQAVARNAAGSLMASQSINVTFLIYDAAIGGTVQYGEDHASVTTNQFGLFTLTIGAGAVISGAFSSIDWAGSSLWLEVKVNGSTAGLRSRLVTVPFALLARDVENDAVEDADADPTNELQSLSISNDTVSLSSGGSVVLPVRTLIKDADGDTKVQVEESPDEDIIRFDVGGTERWIMNGVSLEPVNSGNSVFIGEEAGANDDLGNNRNVFLGHNTGYFNTTGFDNTATGYQALYSNTIGYRNAATGYLALYSNTTGYSNAATGYAALFLNTTGYYNAATGYLALYSNTTGYSNAATGTWALFSNTTGYYNAATGYRALYSNTTGYYNAATGYWALYSNTTGSQNVAMGGLALYSNKAGSRATAVGHRAMYYANNTTNAFDNYNVAVGYEALRGSTTASNNTGSSNTATGYQALFSNTTGYANAATGYQALFSNTTGIYNAATGYQALYSNTTGDDNAAIGGTALYANITGTKRTAIGYSANSVGTAYNNSTGVGYNADPTASNRVHIGNTAVTWIGGQVSWSTYSDAAFKTNITEEVHGLDFITKLRPVTYHFDLDKMDDWKAEHHGERDSSDYPEKYEIESIKFSGFLAQEVEAAAQQVGYDFSGLCAPKHADDAYALRYAEFVVPLVKAVQEQQAMIEEQRAQIEVLQQTVARQDLRIEQLLQIPSATAGN